jgi:hypothetical protein
VLGVFLQPDPLSFPKSDYAPPCTFVVGMMMAKMERAVTCRKFLMPTGIIAEMFSIILGGTANMRKLEISFDAKTTNETQSARHPDAFSYQSKTCAYTLG